MVLALEEMILSKNATAADRVCAGFFLICIYMRARFSDGLSMGEFFLDQPGGDSVGLAGYIEARVYRSKTSHNLQRKVDVLPMVCPLQRFSKGNWFLEWQAARREAAVPEGPEVPLLPAQGSISDWTLRPLKAAQAAMWLRGILSNQNFFPRDEVAALGTHSCKVTLLSWCAKAGVERSTGRTLGYHSLLAIRWSTFMAEIQLPPPSASWPV